jgi:hypothetical protein
MIGKRLGIILGCLTALCTIFLVMAAIMTQPVIENQIMKMNEKRVPFLVMGDGDPGGATGFFYFMIYPHQAVPGTAYASNLSNASAYEYSDVGDAVAIGDTPYGTTFDIVIKVGVTDDDGVNTTTSNWDDTYMWANLTCADLSIGADTAMTELEIVNGSSYRYMHYYMNNGGAGYTITEGQSFNVTSVKLWVMRIV